jgi:hypothetical protein
LARGFGNGVAYSNLRWLAFKTPATVASMLPRLPRLFLLVALLWQSLAMAIPAGALQTLHDNGHDVLHWNGEAHHHHDDGSYDMDDSASSQQHLMADAAAQPSALVPSERVCVPPSRSPSPDVETKVLGPPPFIEGPHRPPR